ncbi:MAG: VOC family protein, partial [Methyloligellaceae bacterium]
FWGEPPCFCIIGRGSVTIFLDQLREPGDIPVNQYWAAYVYVDNVDAFAEEIRKRDGEILRGPENMPHGCREFDVRDPDGHIIAFGQDLDPPEAGPGL